MPSGGHAPAVACGRTLDAVSKNHLEWYSAARNLRCHIYDTHTLEGNRIRIAFEPDSIGCGLVLGNPPPHLYDAVQLGLLSAPPEELTGFIIAGADNQFVEATAFNDKANTVVVSSDAVVNLISGRYAWANTPQGDLYDKEGLPPVPSAPISFQSQQIAANIRF